MCVQEQLRQLDSTSDIIIRALRKRGGVLKLMWQGEDHNKAISVRLSGPVELIKRVKVMGFTGDAATPVHLQDRLMRSIALAEALMVVASACVEVKKQTKEMALKISEMSDEDLTSPFYEGKRLKDHIDAVRKVQKELDGDDGDDDE